MSTFKVSVISRLKHGAIREALLKRGWTQKRCAEYLGISQYQFGKMINLQKLPKLDDEQIEKLMNLTEKSFEDLFPPEVFSKEYLEKNKVLETFVDVQLMALPEADTILALPSPDKALERKEVFELIREGMNELTDRERLVINKLFFEDYTAAELARKLGVCHQTILNTQRNALMKLRQPCHLKGIREAINANSYKKTAINI